MHLHRLFRSFIVLSIVALGVIGGGAQAATKTKPKEPAKPVELTGTVSRVVDGDTLWLATAGASEPVVVRIEGIDAPESCQVGGKEATAALTALALSRSVRVRVIEHDDYGRTVGRVFDGVLDLGNRMVRDGQAWSTRYKFDRGPYVGEERMALALKRGLHAPGGAVMPRDFRKQHGPCEGAARKPSSAAPVAFRDAVAAAPTGTVQTAATARHCDGRRYCSQMTSCDEATWFLQHCAGTQMDGDRDGVPCETQWCRK